MRSILHLSLLALSAYGYYDDVPIAPQTERMEPRVGKPGTIIKITGKALDRSHVDEVYFTDHRFDMKVKVLEQNFTQLVVRVPPFVKPGRLQLLLLTSGNKPVYLEQPWYLLVEAGDDDSASPPVKEISQKSKPSVEVAATGTQIPVPMAGAAPSPATTSSLEKSIVPLKPETRAAAPMTEAQQTAAAPAPVAESKAPVEIATAKPLAEPVRLPNPSPPPVADAPAPAGSKSTLVPAQLVRRAPISYPSAASAQRVEGVVQLTATVRTDGHVKDIKVVRGNPLLVGSAMAAVQDWFYEPATIQGRPVESEVSIVLNYKRP